MGFRFSANTGFLFKDRPFLERIAAAKAAGFDALEFHDEAQTADPAALADALAAAALPVLGINIRMGDTSGCAAIPGAADQARRDIDAAATVASRIGATAIHAVAGKTDDVGADAAYRAALDYALGATDLIILIEPISKIAIPGYFLSGMDQARTILEEIDHPRLKILFDCYHAAAMTDGDILTAFASVAPWVGHVQIAAYPGRDEPRVGAAASPDFARLLPALAAAGYPDPFGCEYRPTGDIAACLADLRTIA